MITYLHILREEVVGEYVKGTEVSNFIELEDHLHIMVWEGVVSPCHPPVTCNQEVKY
jgi:hypothetical protein